MTKGCHLILDQGYMTQPPNSDTIVSPLTRLYRQRTSDLLAYRRKTRKQVLHQLKAQGSSSSGTKPSARNRFSGASRRCMQEPGRRRIHRERRERQEKKKRKTILCYGFPKVLWCSSCLLAFPGQLLA